MSAGRLAAIMVSRPAGPGLLLVVAVAAADQVSKAWALDAWFDPPRQIEVAPFLNLVAVWNAGISFGLFSDSSDAGPHVLLALAVVIAAALTGWLFRTRRRLVGVALGCVIGGAIGNIIDRVRFRAVVDFIDIHAAGYHWPAFNIADAAITIGVGLLLLDGFLNRDDQAAESHKAGDQS